MVSELQPYIIADIYPLVSGFERSFAVITACVLKRFLIIIFIKANIKKKKKAEAQGAPWIWKGFKGWVSNVFGDVAIGF